MGMSTPTFDRIVVAPKRYVVNSNSDWKHSVFQVLGSLKATGMSGLKNIINPYYCLSKKDNFSIKTTND